jgi:hypothetical protein
MSDFGKFQEADVPTKEKKRKETLETLIQTNNFFLKKPCFTHLHTSVTLNFKRPSPSGILINEKKKETVC